MTWHWLKLYKREPILEFTVPGIPVAKGRPRFRVVIPKDPKKKSFVHTYTAKETVHYEEVIASYCQNEVYETESTLNPSWKPGMFPLDEPLILVATLTFVRPKSRKKDALMDRKPDISNVIKGLEDGMSNGGALKNDSRIVESHERKLYGPAPSTHVQIYTIP